jgi:endonuclease YncB( thermonuclease family)
MAVRRTDQDDCAPLAAEKLAADTASPVPFAPAFAGPLKNVIDGDSLEVDRDGKPCKARLFDVAVEKANNEEAKALMTRVLGSDPVWVFPSTQRRISSTEPLPVRIWTREGWLAAALLKAGLAKRLADPDKPGGESPAEPEKTPAPAKDPKVATPKPKPVPKEPRQPSPGADEINWIEVPVTQARSDSLSVESGTFQIPGPEWRLSWSLSPVRRGGIVILNILRVDDEGKTRRSATLVASFSTVAGAQVMRSKPGNYYIRLTGTNELKTLKLEWKQVTPGKK